MLLHWFLHLPPLTICPLLGASPFRVGGMGLAINRIDALPVAFPVLPIQLRLARSALVRLLGTVVIGHLVAVGAFSHHRLILLIAYG